MKFTLSWLKRHLATEASIEEIGEARLVLTEELVTEALRRAKHAEREAKAAKKLERKLRHKSGQAGLNRGD